MVAIIEHIPSSDNLVEGPPTRSEFLERYPSRFTWEQLRTLIAAGDLRLLQKHEDLRKRYHRWGADTRSRYGSLENYLLKCRLRWGQPDRQSDLDSVRQAGTYYAGTCGFATNADHFTARIHPSQICIIQNDWPYSIPAEVEHSLIWTKLPIIHPSTIHPTIALRVAQDGLWGFTGAPAPPRPSPADLRDALENVLAEWGIAVDGVAPMSGLTSPNPEEERHLRAARREVNAFVAERWKGWDTCWFVNPPRIQSVKGLAHIHVFARRRVDSSDSGSDSE